LKPVTISDPARQEFREAVDWYRDRDERVAVRFIAETRSMLELISQFPNVGGRPPLVEDPIVRQMPIHNFPYNIVFVDLGDHLEVAAFAHKRRRPEDLIARLARY
jgi:plasmid stabilization system protein ParE